MTRTPQQALQGLRAVAGSGQLDEFCAEHGIHLLVANSRGDPAPRGGLVNEY